ncbi:MAG TPA: hypothetical protein VHL59_07645, partial [Thermoanaerobaculia bacterium]|nr:hypothetical protein [Thermoanaerobaculia bacterium]
MRAATTITLLLLALTLAGACNQRNESASTAPTSQPAVAASPNLSPEQLGELGAQIKKNPDRANDLLTQHGLTHASYEKMIRDVTENPDASKRYA